IGGELNVPEVKDEQVASVLEQLRESHATWVPVEHPVALGDRVAMDVHGTVGEETIVDRHDVEYAVRAESTQPVPGFAEALVGANAGEEKSFTIHLADDFEDSELAGKDVAFQVQVHWVKEKHLPELDDAFASTVGAFSTLDELREHARGQLAARAEATARRELQDGVLEAVVQTAALELPPQAIAQHAEPLPP